ncbi:MAG: hypothetical protein L0G22_00770 [Propionibacteriaceae bacterium]|nr:hypothetical protein [Propionibacteriaceae bacterium]
MARSLEQNMGPDALRAATGRDHEGWRNLLTAAGALGWDHRSMARYLVDEHGLDGWWAQGVTVDFEQARKGRLPGQQADGTFTVARTATVAGERLADATRLQASAQPPNNTGTPVNLTWSKLPDAASIEVARAGIDAVFDAVR